MMPGERLRGSPLLFLFATVFVDMIGYGIVIPLLPFYVRQYAAGAILVGLLGSLYAAMQFVGGPFLGGLSDRYGRRTILIFCLFGVSLAYLLLGLAQTLVALIVAVILAGGSSGTLTTAQAYIADSTAPEQRVRGLGLIGAAFGLGLMVGPALGGFLSVYSLKTPAFAASALAIINATFGYLVLPESHPPSLRKQISIFHLNPISQLIRVLRMVDIRTLLLVIFLLNLSFAGLISNFPLFSNVRFGWTPTGNGFFFAFIGVCAVTTQGVLMWYLQPRLGELRLLFGGLSIMSLDLVLMALVPFGWMLYPVVGLLAVGTGLAIPSLTGIISNRTPVRVQGRLMGGIQAILSLAMIFGPILAGLSFDYIGVSAPYLIGGVLAVLALTAAAKALLPSPRSQDVRRAETLAPEHADTAEKAAR